MTNTHTRYDSSGRGIGPSQRPDDTQHWQETAKPRQDTKPQS